MTYRPDLAPPKNSTIIIVVNNQKYDLCMRVSYNVAAHMSTILQYHPRIDAAMPHEGVPHTRSIDIAFTTPVHIPNFPLCKLPERAAAILSDATNT